MHKAEPSRKQKPKETKVREEVDTAIVIDSDDDNVKIKQEHMKIEPEEVKVKEESYIYPTVIPNRIFDMPQHWLKLVLIFCTLKHRK